MTIDNHSKRSGSKTSVWSLKKKKKRETAYLERKMRNQCWKQPMSLFDEKLNLNKFFRITSHVQLQTINLKIFKYANMNN